MSKQIVIPGNEILSAQEMYFNESAAIAGKYADNVFQSIMQTQKLIAAIYVKAYESGYRQCELEAITNEKEAGQ